LHNRRRSSSSWIQALPLLFAACYFTVEPARHLQKALLAKSNWNSDLARRTLLKLISFGRAAIVNDIAMSAAHLHITSCSILQKVRRVTTVKQHSAVRR